MWGKLVILAIVSTICHGRVKFKFDYTFVPDINGWLKLHLVPATWNDARLRCHAKGGILASPLSRKLQDAIVSHVSRLKPAVPVMFTGVHATFSKGAYFSVEGIPLIKLPVTWAPGEPDNKNDTESCLAMQINGSMMDVKCSDPLPYVCYKKQVKKLKLTNCRTYDHAYLLEPRTGSCYKFHRWGQSWSRAYMTCAAEGAHLAIVNSETESEVLREIYAQSPNDVIIGRDSDAAYLGYRYWSTDWMTIHSKTMTEAGYEHWYPGEPNNFTQPEGEFCVAMYRGGEFNDASCSPTLPFVCEKSVTSNDEF